MPHSLIRLFTQRQCKQNLIYCTVIGHMTLALGSVPMKQDYSMRASKTSSIGALKTSSLGVMEAAISVGRLLTDIKH